MSQIQKKNNTYNSLRDKFYSLNFNGASWKNTDEKLTGNFHFTLHYSPEQIAYEFRPSFEIPKKQFSFNDLPDELLELLVKNIGLIELISYWKLACPKRVILEDILLTEHQIRWWKNLYFWGLGEFFFVNTIDSPSYEEFLNIECKGLVGFQRNNFDSYLSNNSVLVPIGGGKDSSLTLEILGGSEMEKTCFIINPTEASLKSAEIAGYSRQQVLEVNRILDKKLIELNSTGEFLNGHTPFSAAIAFYALLATFLKGNMHIALSNESSANEASVPETKVNHQYSKSIEFEDDFRNYVKEIFSDKLNYFSILRPLNELQIAKYFSLYPKYFSDFKSCNKGSKTNAWCNKCPKCLFTYIILAAHLDDKELKGIFGKNLYEDRSLEGYLRQLVGEFEPGTEFKPFECVGTNEEVNIAIVKAISERESIELPYLLQIYKRMDVYERYKQVLYTSFMQTFNEQNNLNDDFNNIVFNFIQVNEKDTRRSPSANIAGAK